MRQLVFGGPFTLTVEDARPGDLGPGEIRIAVHSVGVCGSDVHGYAGVNARRTAGMVMGHEAVGTVTELGPGVEQPALGTMVAVNPVLSCGECEFCRSGAENVCERRRIYGCVPGLPGAYAETFLVRASNAVPFEGAAPPEWGALVEPFSVGAHAAGVAGVGRGSEVLVIGGGPIGLGAALGARRRGAALVLVSEPNAHRREVAAALGFETLDPSSSEAPASSFAIAFDCVGHSATLAAALRAVPPRGRVVFVGLAEETIDLPTTPLMVGERTIAGSSVYTSADFRETADWIAGAEDDLSPVIEERVDLDGLAAVFEGYASGSLAVVKTVLQPTA
jgi:threonine dehydrogenase-like Zn-dependent dehydrogenase